mmetsp:Transcript_30503/g.29131  ORF Transcript_30503/g.29131 Transcript_30503/m.29131 type:complete len:302 (+) Transcript_30503:128-1033(+)
MGNGSIERHRRTAVIIIRTCLTSAFILSLLFILIGSALNNLNHKYSRSSSISRTCAREIFILSVPNSELCCDDSLYISSWVCIASFDTFNKLFASFWALIIPLIPIATTILTEYLYKKIIDQSSAPTLQHIRAHSNRLILYILIILYRMYVLYQGGEYVQTLLRENYGGSDNSCWYFDLIKGTRCKNHFDFSDHIVLYLVQYIIPSTLELTYIYIQHYKNNKKIKDTILKYFVPILASLFVICVSTRGILLTCTFFHTGLESLTAVGIIFLFFLFPLYYVISTPIFLNTILMLDKIPSDDK